MPRAVPPLLFAALAAGCGDGADPVRVYTVTPVGGTPDAAAVPPAAPAGRGMSGVQAVSEPQRLLGAIAENGGKLWFFKTIGPVADVAAIEPAFGDWLASVRFEGGEPAWDVPTGWLERPGAGMRTATLLPPGGPEVTVIALGSRAGSSLAEQIDANFTRWRGQVGAAEGGTVEEVTLRDGTAASLLSVSSPDAGTSPAVPKASAPPPGDGLTYDLPDGWIEAAPSAMQRLAFRTGPGEDAAEVSVSSFPAGSMPAAQVAGIWRQQAGAADGPPVDDADPLTVAGEPAPRIDLPAAEPGGTAVFGTAAERAGALWLFKLTGSQDAVDAARFAFEAWLRSVTFPDPATPAGATP